MEVYLIRHGATVNYDEDGPLADKDRYVSKEGLEDLYKKFTQLRLSLEGKNFRILTSPLYRARQTAQLLQSLTAMPLEVMDFDAVTRTKNLKEALKAYPEAVYCVISHEPFISRMIWDIRGEKVRVPMGTIHKVDM